MDNKLPEARLPQEFILDAFADPASVRDVVRGESLFLPLSPPAPCSGSGPVIQPLHVNIHNIHPSTCSLVGLELMVEAQARGGTPGSPTIHPAYSFSMTYPEGKHSNDRESNLLTRPLLIQASSTPSSTTATSPPSPRKPTTSWTSPSPTSPSPS